MEEVVLVDSKDNPIGTMEKMEVHKKGLLHRAFSILLFNKNGELMLQKRASEKYHSADLWTNTCCSHPKPDEPVEKAASRRLKEEMGISTELTQIYKFIYRYEFSSDLVEHELDHVFIGLTEQEPEMNPKEASHWKWIPWDNLQKELVSDEKKFTFWFRLIVNHLVNNPNLLPPHVRKFVN